MFFFYISKWTVYKIIIVALSELVPLREKSIGGDCFDDKLYAFLRTFIMTTLRRMFLWNWLDIII